VVGKRFRRSLAARCKVEGRGAVNRVVTARTVIALWEVEFGGMD
jgi:hypothetical protein